MSALERVVQHARETAMLESITATVEWDERTYMPTAAGPYRAQQLTLLSGIIHARHTDQQYGENLKLAADEVAGEAPHTDNESTVRVLQRGFDKRSRVPRTLVEELTKNAVVGQHAWIEARKQKKFSLLKPFLERTIQLKQAEADALGYEECMYDALLDEFEPYEKTSRVREIFTSLRDRLVPMLQAIVGCDRRVPADILQRDFPIAQQREIATLAANLIGFDFEDGRLDVTSHPFCTTLGPHDIRLTTRYDESYFPSALFGTLHEAGHGIYEQGLRKAHFGLPPGKHASMAIHESQSRLWENLVGRSKSFWNHLYPTVRRAFPQALEQIDESDFYLAINEVKPSLIRVDADEVTYNLHIIIRFELEQELVNGRLTVADLPEAWNVRYQDILGVVPPDDGEGVLQDIHWSAACIGYFPTYALGNLYAAQFFEKAKSDLGDLDAQFARGEFETLKQWLQKHVHQVGQCYSAAELVEHVTGRALSDEPLIDSLTAKFGDIYGF